MMTTPTMAVCLNSAMKDADGLHSCESCNPLHHLLQENSNSYPVPDHNFEMSSNSQDEQLLEFSPDDSDLNLMDTSQPDALVSVGSGVIASNEANSTTPTVTQNMAKTVEKPKPVDPRIKLMKAKIEEMQQEMMSLQNRRHHSEMEEKRMKKEILDLRRDSNKKYQEEKSRREELEKEVIALKRRRSDSWGSSTTTASVSRSRAGDFPACRNDGQRFPVSMNQEDGHQGTLSFRRLDLPEDLKTPQFMHSWAKQGTRSPLQKPSIILKLEKQGFDLGILAQLSCNTLMDVLCNIVQSPL